MAYTGGETVTLTAGQTLEGPSSIANTLLTGADEYARILYASNATLGTVSVSSGGQLYLRGNDTTVNSINVQGLYTISGASTAASGGRLFVSGGRVAELTLDNEGQAWQYGGEITNLILSKTNTSLKSSVKLLIYGGSVMGGSNAGNAGAKEIYAWGGVVSNFTMNANAYIFASNGGCFKDCTFSGTWFAIRGGTAERVTFLNAATQSHHRMSTGLMSDCTIVAGASYAMIGGKAVGTIVSGANARFRVSGANAVMEGGTVVSGGSLLVSVGKVSGTTVGSSGWMLVSGQNARAENIVQSGQNANAAVSAGAAMTNATLDNSAGLTVYDSCTVNSAKLLTSTWIVVSSGGVVNDAVVSGASARIVVRNGVVNRPVVNEWTAWGYASGGAVINDADVNNGGRILVYSGGTLYNPNVSQTIAVPTGASCARIEVQQGGYVSGGTGGHTNRRTVEIYVRGGGTVEGMTFLPGAFVLCAGTVKDCLMMQNGAQQVTVRAGLLQGGTATSKATITVSSGTVDGVVVQGGAHAYCVNIANTSAGKLFKDVIIRSGGTVTMRNNGSGGAIGLFSSGVVMSGGSLVVSNTGVARDVRVEQGAVAYTYNAANFSGGQIFGALRVTNGGKTSGALIQSGGVHHVSGIGSALDTVVYDGGAIRISSGGVVVRAQVSSGGSLYMTYDAQTLVAPTVASGAYVSAALYSGSTARAAAVMDNATNFDATLTVDVHNSAKTYTIATIGNENMTVAAPWLMFDNVVTAGNTYVNPFLASRGKFTLSADGTTFSTAACATTNVTAAKSLTVNGDVLGTKHGATMNANDRAALWSGTKIATVTESVALAEGADADCGNLWLFVTNELKVDTALYGAAKNQNFANDVNYYLFSKAEIKNLAAGADYGGSVGGVNLYVTDAIFNGVAYAGGFGTVTNDVNIQVNTATTEFKKDFYTGALYNAGKVAASTTTSVGDISVILNQGTYKGNIYGASAVKAGTITTVENQAALHTVGDVTLTINNGTATKGTQACIFAAGYATGHDTAKLAAVYTVDSVTLTIADGTWGQACGGRGVFGGAFASDSTTSGTDGVWAKVGNVNLTVYGGTMGNVYGGGWAQKGAKSEVGNVNLTISGGTIKNVFGGGSTSTSGGSTVAGKVTITVSGGTINGDIYARGQNATDATGAASVIFTGAKNFSCGVWGYSYIGGAVDGSTLRFTDYSGTFSGKLGGFDGIWLDGGTSMTLGSAAEINNTAWTFDLAGRSDLLTDASLLTWTAEAGFTGDKVVVNFADADQAAAGWSIAAADFTGATFDLCIDGATAVADIAYDTAISGGDWDGWKFTNVDGTLKFQHLA